MTMLTTGANPAFLPEAAGSLIVQPVIEQAVATQVATVVRTSAHKFRVPVITDDPSAAWTPEGQEITPSDQTLDEVEVNFYKLAGLSIISRELAEDTSPAAAQIVGAGIARDIARKLDVAFFGNVANAPDGLDTIDYTGVECPATWTDTDPLVEAISEAEEVGARLTSFCMDPALALALGKLKDGDTSNKHLLQPDPTAPQGRTIAGLPVFVTSAVSPGFTPSRAWGIPKDRVLVVIRDDVRLEVDRSAYFSSDRVGIKATMRVGFAFPHEAAVVLVENGVTSA